MSLIRSVADREIMSIERMSIECMSIEVHLAVCAERARAIREMSGREAGVECSQAIGTGVVIHSGSEILAF